MTKLKLLGATLHWGSKDGGPESHVYMYGLEIKALCSALVLRFEDGTRDAYHSHAFNATSWVLRGCLREHARYDDKTLSTTYYDASGGIVGPVRTPRECCHQVASHGRTWVLTLRGPWASRWYDVTSDGKVNTLTHGRKAVA